MTYQEAESFLLGREMFGWKLGLERMERFLAGLGAPQEQFDTVHVAGTNGKGSVTAMMGTVFRESGHRCGIYTSPHLESLRERIRVDASTLSDQQRIELAQRLRGTFGRFEFLDLWSRAQAAFAELKVAPLSGGGLVAR